MKEKNLVKAAEVLASHDHDKPINWENVARCVEHWIRKYPEEAKAFQAAMKETRKQLYDPTFASSDGYAERRWVSRVPETLDSIIKAFEPDYQKVEHIEEFLGRFPMFQVPEKL